MEYSKDTLSKKTVVDLRAILKKAGGKPSNLRKTELIAEILSKSSKKKPLESKKSVSKSVGRPKTSVKGGSRLKSEKILATFVSIDDGIWESFDYVCNNLEDLRDKIISGKTEILSTYINSVWDSSYMINKIKKKTTEDKIKEFLLNSKDLSNDLSVFSAYSLNDIRTLIYLILRKVKISKDEIEMISI